MNFKKWMAGMLGAGLVVSMGVSMDKVYADESIEGDVKTTAKSEAEVKFVAPETGGAEVLDPENISEPLKDADGKGTITEDKGVLSLDYVSDISFGDLTVDPSKKTYESVTTAPFIQVTDLRGTGAGWKVRAKVGSFQEVDENGNAIADSLKGASITLSNGKADSPLEASEGQTPTVETPITLSTGEGEKAIATAKARGENQTIDTAQGVGTWLISWIKDEEKNPHVELTVPERSASVGNHVATIEWTLTNDMSSNEDILSN